MKIIIDTNKIISSLIRDGVSRKILFNKNFEFFTPDYSISEIQEHKVEIVGKIHLSDSEFEILLSLIFERISIISGEEYKPFFEESKELISDSDDVPFIAASLAIKADGIWSDDYHFLEQNKLKIFKTENMMNLMGNFEEL